MACISKILTSVFSKAMNRQFANSFYACSATMAVEVSQHVIDQPPVLPKIIFPANFVPFLLYSLVALLCQEQIRHFLW